MIDKTAQPDFAQLLKDATETPGIVSAAYSMFHNYSIGNQILAWMQIRDRGLELGPIASYNGWKKIGRHVSKGQKALVLCMPVTCKRKSEDPAEPDAVFTRFVYRPNWFTLAQTEGAAFEPPAAPEWSKTAALAALEVSEVPYQRLDGNCQGYAQARTVAVNPIAAYPHKTLFHEIAHVVLGHTAEGTILSDSERTPRSIREAEAEGVAMLCCAALGLPGLEESRGYIQHWLQNGSDYISAGAKLAIPETSARKIFKVTDQILKAGKPAVQAEE